MFKVYYGDTCILYAPNDIVLQDPALELAANSAGSFTFTIYPDNPGYTSIAQNLFSPSAIRIYRDSEIIYQGRVIRYEKQFETGIYVETEGDLALLDDTIQRPAEYQELTVRGVIQHILDAHNARCGPDRQFELGVVTIVDPNDGTKYYTNWQSTLTCLKEEIIDKLGGYMQVRYADGHRYLDFFKDCPRLSRQKIEFGENLLSYSEGTDGTTIATVCIPLGAKKETAGANRIEKLEERLTIESVNGGSDALEIPEAVARYGVITRTVTWDDCHVPLTLMENGQRWLQDNQYSELVLELSAVDLADLGIEADHLRLLDEVRCLSAPHGMDRRFPLLQVKLNLLDPAQNVYTLGDQVKSFTGTTTKAQYQAFEQLKNQPSKSHVLEQALENARHLINFYGDEGYVVMTGNEIYIMDTDDRETAQKVWRWNLGGLAYSSTGFEGPYELAITMDGTIAGRFVAAHTIGADQISISYTSEQDKKWQDELGENYWGKVETQTAIENSADSVKIYAQEQAASAFTNGITNYYTKAQIEVKLAEVVTSVEAVSGDYYSKSEIDQKDNAIISTVNTKVGNSEFGTKITQNAESVRLAFNNITSAIQFENAEMNIYNGSNKIISFNSNGMDYYYSGYHVGNIGTGCWVNNSSMRGLVFHLEYSSAYMAWAVKKSSSASSYTTVLCYTNKAYSNYSADRLNLGATMDCQWNTLEDGKFQGNHYSSGGYQGTNLSTVCIPISIRDDGTVASYYTLSLKDGLITN